MTSYTSAIREVLEEQPDPHDMRAVAEKALQKLDPDKVLDLAITALARIARREWNRDARTDGHPVDPGEVLHIAGRDVLLGETEERDRAWIAANHERLADGLTRRAEEIRLFAPSEAPPLLRDVLRMEQRARIAEHAAAATVNLIQRSGADDLSVLERRTETALRAARTRQDAAESLLAEMVPLATVMADPDGYIGAALQRARRAARRLRRVLDDVVLP